jgi:hypothetical protein
VVEALLLMLLLLLGRSRLEIAKQHGVVVYVFCFEKQAATSIVMLARNYYSKPSWDTASEQRNTAQQSSRFHNNNDCCCNRAYVCSIGACSALRLGGPSTDCHVNCLPSNSASNCLSVS